MTTAKAILDLARKELGYNEGPNNDNKYAAKAGHANHQPWCASFVVAMFREGGITLPSESAYTPSMAAGFQKAGAWATAKPQPGHVVFFKWPSMGRIAHVGIVESIRPDGALITIEGNTDPGGGRSGGAVMRHVRRANIAGYGVPKYTAGQQQHQQQQGGGPPREYPGLTKEGMKGPATKAFQQRLRLRGYNIAADGDHGPNTTKAMKAFQQSRHLTADGVGGPATWKALVG